MPSRSRSGGSGSGYAANSYRTEGLVLRTYSLGEADRIIVLPVSYTHLTLPTTPYV